MGHAARTAGWDLGTVKCGHFVLCFRPCPSFAGGNSYFINGYMNKLLVGGGGAGPALQLSADLQSGATYASATYGNLPLSPSPTFSILCLEIYSLQ